jgi:hypothetical protein
MPRSDIIPIRPDFETTVVNETRWIMADIPSDRMLMERVQEFAPERVPTYTLGEASRIFFGRERRYLSNIISRIKPEDLSNHPWTPPPYVPGARWTMADIEKLSYLLFRLKRISYTRLVTALHLIAWTARAHDIYV